MRLKSELYKNEQITLMNKIIEIIKLDKDNSIIFFDLDNNKEKQEAIHKLIPELRKFFSFTKVKSLSYPEQVKRVYLSIIRFVTKLEYNMLSCDYTIKLDNTIIRTKKYIFIKK